MRWHKHMSDMIEDRKIKRLVKRFGAEGYAVYNLVLEKVTKNLSTESPLPDLEETAEDIADLLRMDTLRVEEIVWYCLTDGELFEQDEVTGRVLVSKIYKFIQQSETRSGKIRELVEAYKGTGGGVSDSLRLSQTNVIEQNRTEQKVGAADATHPSLNVPINQTRYDNLCSRYGRRIVDDYIERVSDWASAKGKPFKDYASAAANWMKRDGVPEEDAELNIYRRHA